MGGRGASSGGTGITKSQREFINRQFSGEKTGKYAVRIGYDRYTITNNNNGTYNIRRANATYAKNVNSMEAKKVLTSIIKRENKAKKKREKLWKS